MPVKRTKLGMHLWATAAATLALAAPAHAAEPTKDQCITDNENGQRLQKEGKLREAKEQLLVCISNGCPKLVRDDCADRLRAVDAAQPTIAFDAKDATGAPLTAVSVTLDGAPLTDHLDGSALPIDPGEHKLTFQAAGMALLEQTVVAKAGEKNRHEAIVLGPQAPVAPPQTTVPAPPPVPPPADARSGSSPVPAYAALGVGVAGLAAGAIFTVLWAGAKHDGDAACVPSCDAQTANSWESKQKNDSIGMGIGYGVAVIGGGVGAWLLLSHRSAPAPAPAAVGVSPQVGLGWAGLEGRFQ